MILAVIALEAAAPDPTAWLVNYGVAGIVIALVVLGQLRTKAEVTGLTAQLEQAQNDLRAERAANAALMQQMTNHTLPQMTQLAEVLDRLPSSAGVSEREQAQSLARQVEEMSAMLHGLVKRSEGGDA